MTLRFLAILLPMMALLLVAGCAQEPSEPVVDENALNNSVQKLTEDLYWIHLRLDTARSALEEADAALTNDEASAATFHVTEALRALQKADEKVLDLGLQTQQAFGLDRNKVP